VAGFGRSPFGVGPFGRSDTGGDLVVRRFPESYFDDTLTYPAGQTITDNTVDPLLFLLKTYANSVFLRRLDIDSMLDIIDPDLAPLYIVQLTGDMIGVSIDKNDPDFLQRSLLKSASQWLQIKSSTEGYSVRGLASGFSVEVGNYWRIDPIYDPLIPARFKYMLKPEEADDRAVAILHTDKPPGTFPGTPTQEDTTYAKSAYVKLIFQIVEPRIPLIDYNTLLDLVISKIRDVAGIHHELQAPELLTPIYITETVTANFVFEQEFGIFQASECYYFDITPADAIETDVCYPTVSIAPGDQIVLQVSSNLSVVLKPEETDSEIEIDAEVGPITVNIQNIYEQTVIGEIEVKILVEFIQEAMSFDITEVVTPVFKLEEQVFHSLDELVSIDLSLGESGLFQGEEFYHFDITPADVVTCDAVGNVLIVIP
jgi:hypothetical protein